MVASTVIPAPLLLATSGEYRRLSLDDPHEPPAQEDQRVLVDDVDGEEQEEQNANDQPSDVSLVA